MSTRSRRRFDDDDLDRRARQPIRHALSRPSLTDADSPRDPRDPDDGDESGEQHSTYADDGTTRGPAPVPAWVITSPAAIDTDAGVLKTGKEADVSLLRRAVGAAESWLAVKRYRAAEHRLFHRDAGYLEGRRVRRSRETRAMARRTDFGKELIAGQWAAAEFAMLSRCWSAGIAVPYPVQLRGTEVMMEFMGDDGVAAPRLAETRPDPGVAAGWFAQITAAVVGLAELGYAHGDLSAYNVLARDDRLVLIDLPQAVDLVGNPQGLAYLHRDCQNICGWFTVRGVHADPIALYERARQTLAH